MLTGYFQSFKLGLVSIGAVPGVVCGVAIILLMTGTTLNIESFMGSIMCIGVSVSNSVLLSTFMDDHWRAGATVQQAAIEGAKDRLRPILMTALAMILGTVPMALALEEGSEMTAPLGRAVIGGLVVSTFATLLVVPAIFALLMGDKEKVSPSVDPDDPQSRHYESGHVHVPEAAHGGPKPDEAESGEQGAGSERGTRQRVGEQRAGQGADQLQSGHKGQSDHGSKPRMIRQAGNG